MKAGIAVYKLLSNSAEVTAIVGANIFPNVVPQKKTGDAITYTAGLTTAYDGKGAYNDYDETIMQISCFCADYAKADELIEAVRTALERESGTFGDAPNTVDVDNIFFQSAEDLGWLNDVEKYHKVIDFKIFTR